MSLAISSSASGHVTTRVYRYPATENIDIYDVPGFSTAIGDALHFNNYRDLLRQLLRGRGLDIPDLTVAKAISSLIDRAGFVHVDNEMHGLLIVADILKVTDAFDNSTIYKRYLGDLVDFARSKGLPLSFESDESFMLMSNS